jgi:hypothetical protein
MVVLRHRLVVFGGWNEHDGLLGDVVALAGDAWRPVRLAAGEAPAPRHAAGMVVDGRGRAVLFGGEGAGGLLDDTWLLEADADGTRWTRLDPAVRPGPRAWHAMGYDPARRAVVVFGGSAPGGARDAEVWELDDEP